LFTPKPKPGPRPGDIYLRRPADHVWWCLKEFYGGRLSLQWHHALRILVDFIAWLLLFPILKSRSSHVLRCLSPLVMTPPEMRKGKEFLHAKYAKSVIESELEFAPGYLATCLVLRPACEWLPKDDQFHREEMTRIRISAWQFICVPLVRLKAALCTETLKTHEKDIPREEHTLSNCCELIALGLQEQGGGQVYLSAHAGVPRKGLLPVDFLRSPYFAREKNPLLAC